MLLSKLGKIFAAIMAMPLSKMGGKKNSGFHTNGMNGMANIAKRTTVEVAGSIIASTSFTTGMLLATT